MDEPIEQDPPSPKSLAKQKLSRRKFLMRLGIYGGGLAALGSGFLAPHVFRVKRRKLGDRGKRLAHLTDLHYKGGRSYLERVVARINHEKPDAVLCTGDFIEKREYLAEALEILGNLEAPLFAVPGNHDFWGGADFDALAKCCSDTGGRWLEDETFVHDGWLNLTGVIEPDFAQSSVSPVEASDTFRVLLCHYPAIVDSLVVNQTYDLILAGHSHGGQVRLPFFGPLILPSHVGGYDMGWFDLPCGPLHVSTGIGTYFIPIRFCCRPDVAIIDV
jgi:predicted MPP superfamily phosphohydrolase